MKIKMLTVRRVTILAHGVLSAGSLLLGQNKEMAERINRVMKSNEADQIAYFKSYIAKGAPRDDSAAEMLVLSKSSVFVPMLELEIEEIARSPAPERLFEHLSLDPQEVVDRLALMIVATHQKIALEQASKLMKLDEKAFGDLVPICLDHALVYRKGLQFAYRGFEIGDPAVDKRIVAWFDEELGAGEEAKRTNFLNQWAEAMATEYKGAPNESQWAEDPIVSRLSKNPLNPDYRPSLHDDLVRRIQEAETPIGRVLKSSEADQISYLNSSIAVGTRLVYDEIETLVLSKTSLFVPMLERKIEEIVRSPAPELLFKDPPVEPKVFVNQVVAQLEGIIASTGEKLALEQASKLMKIDEDRFGPLVTSCLTYAGSREKAFQLVYRGLEIGDAALDKRLMAWMDLALGESNRAISLRLWAEAMATEYNGAPDSNQWARDPIVSRLQADQMNPIGRPSLHDEMSRLIAEAIQNRPQK